jgi:hypothetical protein
MSIKLNDDQYLLWIKDPSISPFTNDYGERKHRKNILSDEALKNPVSFLNKIKRITFYDTSIREDIVKQINSYKQNNAPRLYTLNDKWKYAKNEILNQKSVNIDYIETYFDVNECKKWVDNHLVNPRTDDDIQQNSSIYIELLYTTIQYGIDITNIENNLIKSSSSKSSKSPKSPKSSKSSKSPNTLKKRKDKITQNIIDGIQARLMFMKENDELFLNHNIESFDKLLNINDAVPKKPKLKNTDSVSTSPSPESLNSAEKRKIRDNILVKNVEEKEFYEYNRLKKHQKKLHKIALVPDVDFDVDVKVFSKFKTFLHTLDNKIGRYKWEGYHPLMDSIIRGNSEENKDNEEFIKYVKIFYEMYNIELKDDITDIVRKFIYNIYEQIINNPTYQISSVSECFSYVNKSAKNFDKYQIISKIKNALHDYVDNYRPKLDRDIIKYFKFLVEDIIPRYYVFVLHKYNNGKGRDERKIIFYDTEGYLNHYYIILFNNTKRINNIQYRLPEGKGFLNGKSLMRKFAALLNDPYFNSNIVEKIIVPDDDDLNDFSYEECKNWVIMPIINPRTFEQISIDSPIYNRLLCMTYQYDCNLIPRMITSRGAHIITALKKVLEKILIHSGKPSQTREQLEEYIIEKQFIKEKGNEISKFIPKKIGLKWKDYGTSKPSNGIDITEHSKALVEAMEIKIRKERIASRSSQDPVAFYVFFNKTEWDNFGITNITKDSFIKVKAHYYIPVVEKINDIQVRKPRNKIVRNSQYIVKNHYNIVNCLKWVMQPNKDPITSELIYTDSPEYNEIFEQALIFDSNIQPIDITPKGIDFKKEILKIKKKFFNISKFKNKKRDYNISTAKREDIINNSEICQSINNIYIDDENDTKYIDFRNKMLEMCDKYLGGKHTCNLATIKKKLKEFNDKFVKEKNKDPTAFRYYEESALCSVIVDYDAEYTRLKLYDNSVQNNYINQYKRIFTVYINELVEIQGRLQARNKRAIDAGGVSREFFTKLFEELFCDENNENRPFILPEKNSGANRYYINPNFEPDEKFRKVLKYINDNMFGVGNYNTETEYDNIYSIIGKILGVAVVNEEIGLPKKFSTYILARFINPEKNINKYDILYFYLRDFNNSSSYINMMNVQQKHNIEFCDFTFNDYYILSKSSKSNPGGQPLTKDNYIKYILELSNYAVTKNFIFNGGEESNKKIKGSNKNMKGRYDSLCSGFNNELRTFFNNNNVTIDILDKLITNEQLDQDILTDFATKMKISVIKYVDDRHDVQRWITTLTEQEKEAIKAELRTYLTNIIINKRVNDTDEEHYEFIKRLLQFWTGFDYYDKYAEKEGGYKFFYMYGADTRRYPNSHTCSYQFDFYGFPEDKITAEDRETYLYEKIKFAIFGAPGMDLA